MKTKKANAIILDTYSQLKDLFGLTAEINITYGSISLEGYDNGKYEGLYETVITFDKGMNATYSHKITIDPMYGTNAKRIIDIFVHELVHAWQYERSIPTKHNRKSQFKRWKKDLLKYYGIEI